MIEIDGESLTIEQVVAVARRYEPVRISDTGMSRLNKSCKRLEDILKQNRPVYGINTGFGIFADRRIPITDSARLSRNLIISHSIGTGPALREDIVRAAILVRCNTLVKGLSGVRPEVVATMLDLLNSRVTPVIPSQGSLGSSGDLCQLSHMALVFTTDEEDRDDESGWAVYQGQTMTGKAAMQAAGLKRVILGPKEGLAVNNGATFCAAIAALAVFDSQILLDTAEVSAAMTLESLLGCSAAFDARIHRGRNQVGQMETAQAVVNLVDGSTLVDSAGRVQDAYSLRCSPQVQGACLDTVRFVRSIAEREINAATDNPLLVDDGVVLSGGNFHGEPVGLAMDYLGIAMTELGAISERRIFRLTDGKLNGGLPPMLVNTHEDAGLNSGYMMPQYTAVSLVLENQTLATPDSVHSLPTSGEQEDHNANAMTAARHANEIIQNTAHVLGIELCTAARALDLRMRMQPDGKPGKGTQKAHAILRKQVPYRPGDCWWGPELQAARELVLEGAFSREQIIR